MSLENAKWSVMYETYNPLCLDNGEAYSCSTDTFCRINTPCLDKTHYVIEGFGYIPYLKDWERRCVELFLSSPSTRGSCPDSGLRYPAVTKEIPWGELWNREQNMLWLVIMMCVLVYCFDKLIWKNQPKKKGNKKCYRTGKRQ